MADPFDHTLCPLGSERDAQDQPGSGFVWFDVHYIGHGIHQPFGTQKAVREIRQVVGRRHHHRIAEAVNLDRNRAFHRHFSLQRLCRSVGTQA